MKKVTVIVPVYNKKEYLVQCLDSIINQSLLDVEVICVDDGSTDGSEKILDDYKSRGKIDLIHQDNCGAAKARNRAIKLATGEYIALMDCDDYYYDKYSLEKLYNEAKATNANLCAGKIKLLHPNGKLSSFQYDHNTKGFINVIDGARIYGQTAFLYKRNFIVENNICFPNYIRFEDPPFLLEAIIKNGGYQAILDDIYIYRVGYKGRCIAHKTAQDILCGIRDCMRIACENKLLTLYQGHLAYLTDDVFEYYYKYAIEKDVIITNLLNEIGRYGEILCELMGVGQIDSTVNFDEYIYMLKNKYNEIKGKDIVIYGTGEVSKNALDCGIFSNCNILGFAVSNDKVQNDRFYDKEIKSINCYDKSTTIVICANKSNQVEISRNLNVSKFEKYLAFDKNDVLALVELLHKEVV